MTVLGDRAFKRWLNKNEVVWVSPNASRLVSLQEEVRTETLRDDYVGPWGGDSCLHVKERGLRGNHIYQRSDLGLLIPRIVKK